MIGAEIKGKASIVREAIERRCREIRGVVGKDPLSFSESEDDNHVDKEASLSPIPVQPTLLLALATAANLPVDQARVSPRNLMVVQKYYDTKKSEYAQIVMDDLNKTKASWKAPKRKDAGITLISTCIGSALEDREGDDGLVSKHIDLKVLRAKILEMHPLRQPHLTAPEYTRMMHVFTDTDPGCVEALKSIAEFGAKPRIELDKICSAPKDDSDPYIQVFAPRFNDETVVYEAFTQDAEYKDVVPAFVRVRPPDTLRMMWNNIRAPYTAAKNNQMKKTGANAGPNEKPFRDFVHDGIPVIKNANIPHKQDVLEYLDALLEKSASLKMVFRTTPDNAQSESGEKRKVDSQPSGRSIKRQKRKAELTSCSEVYMPKQSYLHFAYILYVLSYIHIYMIYDICSILHLYMK
jgi:hypothetical protein